MSTVSRTAEQRVVIDGVRWSTYLSLLEDGESQRGRMTFDQGVLEIMSPGRVHENVGRLLGRMVEAFTEELEIEVVSVASTTFKREDVNRGFEADEAYYIQNAAAVADKGELDLEIDPPPDLVIEVDISRSSIDKMPLFHSLGVPEIWRYAGDKLSVYLRGHAGYVLSEKSNVLPRFPLDEAGQVIEQRTTVGETQQIRSFRTYIREQITGEV